MKELAQDFDIDGKTAWEYLQKLQQAGLLLHNGRRSAAVRYRLADAFLKVRLAALTRRVALALAPAGLPEVPDRAVGRMAGGHRRGALLGGELAPSDRRGAQRSSII